MKGCRHAKAWIQRAVDGELSLHERFRLEEHLGGCSSCRSLHAAQETLEEALLSLPDPPADRLDLDCAVAEVRAKIDETLAEPDAPGLDARPGSGRRRLARWGVAAVLLGVTAALALRALLAGPVDGDPTPLAEPAIRRNFAPEPAAPETDAVVPTRLDEVRSTVAGELVAALGELSPTAPRAEVEAALAGFQNRTRDLSRSWPLLRIVEGLVAVRDEETARAAARYLGVRGNAISTGALRDGISRPDIAPAAVCALGDLGEPGLDGLADALRDPKLFALALDRIIAVGGEGAARLVEDALGRVARRMRTYPDQGTQDELASLLLALGSMEPPPVESFLRLAERGTLPRGELLGALRNVFGAKAELGALVASGRASWNEEILLDALAVLAPEAALPWIAERAAERAHRDQALACLVAYGDASALAVLVELRANGRVASEHVVATARRVLDEDGGPALDLAMRWTGPPEVPRPDARTASRLLDLLLETESRGSGEALAHLAFAETLSRDERLLAALAVGELGLPDHTLRLVEGMRGLQTGDHRIAAACLLSAHALGGVDGAERALDAVGHVSPRSGRRLLHLCDEAEREGTRAVTLYKVARELETYYDPKHRKETVSAL